MLDRLGFSRRWRDWIRECLSSASVSVLINGSPTKEFSVSKGLRRGDPMAPFLFLIVAEGLSGLIRNAVSLGEYEQYVIRGGVEVAVSHTQYADDTILMGKLSAQNAFVMKCILRCFEMVSGLKVNFYKSCVMGIKESNSTTNLVASLLNCKVGTIPFKFLGILVGANPRRASTWNGVIQTIRSRLSLWKNRFL